MDFSDDNGIKENYKMSDPIQGVGSGAMMPQVGQTHMNKNQKALFQEIISKYDAKNFSQTNFEAMGEELRQAGIGRTSEVKSMLEEAGFNIDQYAKGGPARMPGGPGRGPRPMRGNINIQVLQSFKEILDNFDDLTNMTSEDQENLMNDLTSSGLMRTGIILDLTA